MRNEPRVGLVYVGDGATSTGAFHEGINFAAVQRCPLVVIVENNRYAYSTPTVEAVRRRAAGRQGRRLRHSRASRADGNDVLAAYEVTQRRGGPRARGARASR